MTNLTLNNGARILVVENDPQVIRTLRTVLATQGYQVRVVSDAAAALRSVAEWQPDVVLTDLLMPESDGFDLCARIRAVSNVPVIVLSVSAMERAKVEALDAGADDYMTKPFGTDELLARVRAALRRKNRPADADDLKTLEIGDFRIDVAARRVFVRGNVVRLTPKEFDLLLYLARRPNRVVEHRQLLDAIWGERSREHPEYLRVFVGQLRKKLEPNPSMPRYLATEPWVGYRLNATFVS